MAVAGLSFHAPGRNRAIMCAEVRAKAEEVIWPCRRPGPAVDFPFLPALLMAADRRKR